jgi:hypothetical protein
MVQPDNTNRPLLTERFEKFISIGQLNEWIEVLEIAYAETSNEKVYRVLRDLKSAKTQAYTEFWDAEDFYRSQENRELMENLHLWPHSVRTWATAYRDDEVS